MKGVMWLLSICVFVVPMLSWARNPISVHVLDQQSGLPGTGMNVSLERAVGDRWVMLHETATDEDGRVTALYPEGKTLEKGVYRVTFKSGAWFGKRGTPTFFRDIPVIVELDGKLEHYHVPLLLSPYGYSTYRGS